MLRHIAARQTAWPEYCLSAINTMTAALRDVPEATQSQGTALSGILHHHRSFDSEPKRSFPRQDNHAAQRQAAAASHNDASPSYSTSTIFPHTIATSSGLPEDAQPGLPENHDGDENGPVVQTRERTTSGTDQMEAYHQQAFRTSNDIRNSQVPGNVQTLQETGAAPLVTSSASEFRPHPQVMPPTMGDPSQFLQNEEFAMREGEESLVWYEQLFSHSLGAIDFPYMAAAQFDPSVDPTWAYLR